MRRAVIDVGSNSVLLLIAERHGDTWTAVKETSKVTGLGRGTKQSKLLSEIGIDATLKELLRCFELARDTQCDEVVAFATMAARIATNTQDFLDRAEAQLTPVKVLAGEDEAQFGFLAVATDPLFKDDARLSVIDVGGHSTELVNAVKNAEEWAVLYRNSFPLGALGLREGPLMPDKCSLVDRMSAMNLIDSTIGQRFRPGEAGRVVTLGATGTNLVTVRDRLTEWDASRVHGAILTYEEVSKAAAWLSELGDEGRAALVGIEPGREHTIHAGALLLERFMFAIGAEECTVSTRGWRYGVLEA